MKKAIKWPFWHILKSKILGVQIFFFMRKIFFHTIWVVSGGGVTSQIWPQNLYDGYCDTVTDSQNFPKSVILWHCHGFTKFFKKVDFVTRSRIHKILKLHGFCDILSHKVYEFFWNFNAPKYTHISYFYSVYYRLV